MVWAWNSVCGRFINFKNGRKCLTLLIFGCPADHLYAIVRTSPRATHVVHAGDLVPAGTRLVTRRVARGAMGVIAPPIPKVTPKIFRSMKLLMSKPKKYCSANHRKCLRNLLHNLVEPDQSTVVQQLSMINQTLCTRGGNNIIFQVKPRIFVGWAKMVKFHCFHSKLSKQPFLLNV